MIGIRAKELADSNVRLAKAIDRLCDIIEGRRDFHRNPSNDKTIRCSDCGMFYDLLYGHHCVRPGGGECT